MNAYPAALDEQLEPIPLDDMTEAGHEAAAFLTSKGYEVVSGLTPLYADQISRLSHENSICEYCPKDSKERFTNLDTTREWLSKGRAVYLLIYKQPDTANPELAGYGWIGSKQTSMVPGGETTFSLRVSEHHQGKGLAAPFSRCMLEAAEVTYGAHNMWLETWASNAGAVHIYHKLGFHDVNQKQDERPSLQSLFVSDVRIYMDKSVDTEDS